MKSDAHQFLEGLAGDVKTFSATHGNGPGKAFGSLKDLNAARDHIEKSQHHASMSAEHSDLATTAKGMGNRSIAASHTDASDHHAGLAANHADMAQKHLQKAKTVQPMGEAFVTRGYVNANDLVDFSKYDMNKSPESRGELDEPRPKHSTATVQDLANVANHVAAKYGARVELVRSLGENGFVCALVLQAGQYIGTASPSVSAIAAELVAELRNVAPAAVVDLISQDEIANGLGPSSRRGIFRFRLRNHEFGGF